MNRAAFWLIGTMDHLSVRDTASNPKAATLHTVGTGYKRQTRAGKAYPWWLARLSTSKLLSKLSTMRKAMALRFTMTLPHSKIRLQ